MLELISAFTIFFGLFNPLFNILIMVLIVFVIAKLFQFCSYDDCDSGYNEIINRLYKGDEDDLILCLKLVRACYKGEKLRAWEKAITVKIDNLGSKHEV